MIDAGWCLIQGGWPSGEAIIDDDPLPGRYVRYRRREQVRSLLFNEAGFPALVTRTFVVFPGLFLLAYLAFDVAFADVQPHPVDRRLVRQRKHVDTLDPFRTVIAKFLADRHAGDEAADIHRDVRVRARRRIDALLHLQEQRARLYIRRLQLFRCSDRHPRPGKRQGHDHQCSRF